MKSKSEQNATTLAIMFPSNRLFFLYSFNYYRSSIVDDEIAVLTMNPL